MTPNKALQLTLDPAILFAGAKSTSASNAAELWHQATNVAIEGYSVRFDDGVPSIKHIVAKAEGLCGLSINVTDLHGPETLPSEFRGLPNVQLYSASLVFSDFPDGIAHLNVEPPLSRVTVSNDTGVAPVLIRTLRSALIQMGGQVRSDVEPMDFPLTHEFVEDFTLRYRKKIQDAEQKFLWTASSLVALSLLVLIGLAVAAWYAWHVFFA